MIMEDQIYDYVYETAVRRGIKYLDVILYGGEPMLSQSSNISFLKNLSELNQDKKFNIEYTLVTNGYNMPNNDVKEMLNAGVKNLQITLDGPKHIHDARRIGIHGAMTEERLLKALEYIYFDYFKDISVFRFDFVSGGEPLLNFETIKTIVEICETYNKRGKTTKFWLCTNGIINKKEIFHFLDKHRFNIGISLDGTKKDNDNYRVFRDGTSSYNQVINTLRNILTESTYTRNFRNVWILVVITSETRSLVTILKHLKQNGLKRVQMRIVRTVEAYGLNERTFFHTNHYMMSYLPFS